jgi:hypothetical protein
MMKVVTEGNDAPMEMMSYRSGLVELDFRAASPRMTLGDMAWMIEGEASFESVEIFFVEIFHWFCAAPV